MFAFLWHDVVRVWAGLYSLQNESRLFKDFSFGAILDGFTKLQVPARKRPRSRAVRTLTLAKQYQTSPRNEDTDANAWLKSWGMWLRRHS